MKLPRHRWSAFAVHFGGSLLIFFGLLAIITLFWYPGALFTAAGGWQGIRIVVGVDLVLGPLLTLTVYNLAKPHRLLYRDLSIIGMILLCCLAAGVFIVYDERPVAVVFSTDKFYALKHKELIANGKDPKTLGLKLMSPKYFVVDLGAGNSEEAKVISQLSLLAGKDVLFRTDRYRPIPRDMAGAEKVFALEKQPRPAEDAERCLQAGLVSAYGEGTACYDPVAQRLEKFVAKERRR